MQIICGPHFGSWINLYHSLSLSLSSINIINIRCLFSTFAFWSFTNTSFIIVPLTISNDLLIKPIFLFLLLILTINLHLSKWIYDFFDLFRCFLTLLFLNNSWTLLSALFMLSLYNFIIFRMLNTMNLWFFYIIEFFKLACAFLLYYWFFSIFKFYLCH